MVGVTILEQRLEKFVEDFGMAIILI